MDPHDDSRERSVVKVFGLPPNAYISDVRNFFETVACPRSVNILGSDTRSIVFVFFSSMAECYGAIALSGQKIKGCRVTVRMSSEEEFERYAKDTSECASSVEELPDYSEEEHDHDGLGDRGSAMRKRRSAQHHIKRLPAASSLHSSLRHKMRTTLEKAAAALKNEIDRVMTTVIEQPAELSLSGELLYTLPPTEPHRPISRLMKGSRYETIPGASQTKLPMSSSPQATTDVLTSFCYLKMTGLLSLPNLNDVRHFFFGLPLAPGTIRYAYDPENFCTVFLKFRDVADTEAASKLNGSCFGTESVQISSASETDFRKARVLGRIMRGQMPILRFNLPGFGPVLAGRARPIPSDMTLLLIGLDTRTRSKEIRKALKLDELDEIVAVPRKFAESVRCFIRMSNLSDFHRLLSQRCYHIAGRKVSLMSANMEILREVCGSETTKSEKLSSPKETSRFQREV